jgi:hypothetical protein
MVPDNDWLAPVLLTISVLPLPWLMIVQNPSLPLYLPAPLDFALTLPQI